MILPDNANVIIAVAREGGVLIMEHGSDSWKLAGLYIGVYTGGTPNLAAIKPLSLCFKSQFGNSG